MDKSAGTVSQGNHLHIDLVSDINSVLDSPSVKGLYAKLSPISAKFENTGKYGFFRNKYGLECRDGSDTESLVYTNLEVYVGLLKGGDNTSVDGTGSVTNINDLSDSNIFINKDYLVPGELGFESPTPGKFDFLMIVPSKDRSISKVVFDTIEAANSFRIDITQLNESPRNNSPTVSIKGDFYSINTSNNPIVGVTWYYPTISGIESRIIETSYVESPDSDTSNYSSSSLSSIDKTFTLDYGLFGKVLSADLIRQNGDIIKVETLVVGYDELLEEESLVNYELTYLDCDNRQVKQVDLYAYTENTLQIHYCRGSCFENEIEGTVIPKQCILCNQDKGGFLKIIDAGEVCKYAPRDPFYTGSTIDQDRAACVSRDNELGSSPGFQGLGGSYRLNWYCNNEERSVTVSEYSFDCVPGSPYTVENVDEATYITDTASYEQDNLTCD